MRNEALDSLRGFSVFLMILVNFPGSWSFLYPILEHAKEGGFTIADLVFPIFLWTVGYSIQISLHRHELDSQIQFFSHVTLRFLLLFFCGIFLSLFPHWNWESFRIPGVLQRIAICYAILMFLFRYLSFPKAFWISFSLSFLSILITRFVQVEGAHWQFVWRVPVTEHTLGAVIDRWIFGKHLWKETGTYDPEGILTTFSALLTVLFGMFLFSSDEKKVKRLPRFLTGFGLISFGLLLLPVFPFSKTNWSLSYILFTAGIIQVLYLILQWVFQKENLKVLQKTLQILYGNLGKHALVIFFLSGVLARMQIFVGFKNGIFQFILQTSQDKKLSSFLFSFLFYLFLVGIFQMHRILRNKSLHI